MFQISRNGSDAAKPYQILSSSTLKLIAVVTMFIDHSGYALVYWSERFFPYYQLFRDIGRIAFPIYCFLLVEGFYHTRSRVRYAASLLVFGLLSEIPFNWFIGNQLRLPGYQNVFFTLLVGLLTIWAMEKLWERWIWMCPVLAAGMAAAYLLHTDYDFKGVVLIAVFYLFRDRHLHWHRFFAGCLCLAWEWKAIFAWIPITLYNGKRGWMKGPVLKYAFYLFYPAHLLLLCYLRRYFFHI